MRVVIRIKRFVVTVQNVRPGGKRQLHCWPAGEHGRIRALPK
jgi:hypothetical protein